VNCETDFVARTDEFAVLAREVAALVNAKAPHDVEEALTLAGWRREPRGKAGGEDREDRREDLVPPVRAPRTARRDARMVVPYIHAGGRSGSSSRCRAPDLRTRRSPRSQDLAMQVAAANPAYVSRNDVPAQVIEHEKTIYREQAKASGKPDKILDKIAEGKLVKYFGDFCLVEQAFIKDPDRKVAHLLAEAGKAAGATIAVSAFARFQVGEGMEKRSDDLAAEVAKQLGRG